MHAAFAKPIDWLAIQLARGSVPQKGAWTDAGNRAAVLLTRPDFFHAHVAPPDDFKFLSEQCFQFRSPVSTAWPENNTVFGRLFRCHARWTEAPTVILLHGWNASLSYRYLFPWLASRLNRQGVNAVALELPYHEQRQPRRDGRAINFISDDLEQMLQATRQAVADARATFSWLSAQGCRTIGLWGISLGAWLAGLATCVEKQNQFSVLLTPVARLDQVIRDLPFCAPIRRSLEKTRIDLSSLDLAAQRPMIPSNHILIVASRHDLFAPLDTMEPLRRSWSQPEFWPVEQGHISVLLSPAALNRITGWIAQTASQCNARQRAIASCANGRP